MTLTCGSLFSGIGGFDLGFENAGMEVVWQVEQDKYCLKLLEAKWPNTKRYTDVRNVGKRNLEAVDVICGGFPCQDLSVAGRRAGLAGSRSGLWTEFARIIGELRPRWVVIENVPGLLSSNEGRDMGILTGKLAELRYWWAYRVLDAQYFGLAQRRRRVFIVASLGRTGAAQVLFEPESVSGDSPPRREKGKELAAAVAASPRSRGDRSGTRQDNETGLAVIGFDGSRGTYSGDVAAPLTVNGSGANPGKADNQYVAFGGGNTSGAIDVSTSIATKDFNTETLLVARPLKSGGNDRRDESHETHIAFTQNTRDEVRLIGGKGDRVGALAAQPGTKQQNYVADMGVRHLTPVECERLQGDRKSVV